MSEVVVNFEGKEVIVAALVESFTAPLPDVRGVRLLPVGPGRWRVVTHSGVVAGHLEAHGDGPVRRYRARRFHGATNSFRDVGEFWSPTEAVECLRLLR